LNGPYTSKHVLDDKQVDKPWTEWTKEERRRVQYDCTWTSSLEFPNAKVPKK